MQSWMIICAFVTTNNKSIQMTPFTYSMSQFTGVYPEGGPAHYPKMIGHLQSKRRDHGSTQLFH